jgi:hypothetical protein
MKSAQFTLIKQDLISIAKGAAINFSGAIILYLVEALQKMDWGMAWYAPLATATFATLVNIVRKWVSTTKY